MYRVLSMSSNFHGDYITHSKPPFVESRIKTEILYRLNMDMNTYHVTVELEARRGRRRLSYKHENRTLVTGHCTILSLDQCSKDVNYLDCCARLARTSTSTSKKSRLYLIDTV